MRTQYHHWGLATPTIKIISFVFVLLIITGCGQRILVFDTDRYTPQDPIPGLLPGDPQGDAMVFFDHDSITCEQSRVIFFPITLSTPGTGFQIPHDCSVTFMVADHQYLTSVSGSREYVISWLGHGNAVVTPLFAGVVDNSVSSMRITIDGVRYLPVFGDEELIPFDGHGLAHRILLTIPRSSIGGINLRAESFDEGVVHNDSREDRVKMPADAFNLVGFNVNVRTDFGDVNPYVIADLFITANSN